MASNARRPVLILLIVALAVRGLALCGASNASLVLDEVGYEQRARALLAGQGFVGPYQS